MVRYYRSNRRILPIGIILVIKRISLVRVSRRVLVFKGSTCYISRSIKLPAQGFFSHFPHGTFALLIFSHIESWMECTTHSDCDLKQADSRDMLIINIPAPTSYEAMITLQTLPLHRISYSKSQLTARYETIQAILFPVHSPLLRESQLFSFLSHNDMFKSCE